MESCSRISPVISVSLDSSAMEARWMARFIASKRTAFWALDCWMFLGWVGDIGKVGAVEVCSTACRI